MCSYDSIYAVWRCLRVCIYAVCVALCVVVEVSRQLVKMTCMCLVMVTTVSPVSNVKLSELVLLSVELCTT